MLRCFLHLVLSQGLAVRAIASDFCSGEYYLKPEMRLHLFPELLEWLAEKPFDLPAAQADDVRVLLLHAGLVVMLVATDVHQVEFIDETTGFQHLQSSVDSDAIQL